MEIVDCVSENGWELVEQYWIEQFKAWGFKLTNCLPGGEGIPSTDDIIKRRSITNSKVFHEMKDTYKILEANGKWTGERICMYCSKTIKYNFQKRSDLLKKILAENNVIISRNNKKNFETDNLNFVTSATYSIIAGIGSNYELVIVDDLGNCKNGLDQMILLMPVVKNKMIIFSKPGENKFFNCLVEDNKENSQFDILDLINVADLSIILNPIKPPYSISSMDKTFPIKIYS